MPWFGVGSGQPQRAQQFVEADRVVVEAFADLHEARHLKKQIPRHITRCCATVRA